MKTYKLIWSHSRLSSARKLYRAVTRLRNVRSKLGVKGVPLDIELLQGRYQWILADGSLS